MSTGIARFEHYQAPLAPLSPAVRAATGALWGVALAGLWWPHVHGARPGAVLAIFAVSGAALATADAFPTSALSRTGLAAAAALCGAAMVRVPEPAFFLLVPLLAAGIAWPFGAPPASEKALPRFTVPLLFVTAAFVFFLQSARRHWTFASSGFDLGIFYQSQWLMAHGLPEQNTVLGMHALGDHMLFGEFVLAQLLRVYDGAEALLFAQAVAVASGVFPLYWLGVRFLGRPRGALALPLLWLLSPDVHSGLLYDYNPTCVASAALLWTSWALACRGPAVALLVALGTCALKENFCLYVAALAIVMSVRLVSWRRAAAVVALAGAIFVVEMTVLFPMFRAGGFRHFEFDDLGKTPAAAATAAVTRPDRAATLLVDHAEKRRSLLQPLATVGYLPMADPVTLAMQLPNWGERLLSSHRTRWWGYYYGMPAMATALVGMLIGWRRLARTGHAGPGLPVFAVTCALLIGLLPPYSTHDGDHRSMMYTLRRPYASTPEDASAQRAAVAFIGHDPRVRVAAQHHLIPHLAGRPFIVPLPRAAEADVVALALNGETWPQSRREWRRELRELWTTGAFHVAFCQDSAVVLRRGPEPGVPCPSWDALVSPSSSITTEARR